jgi:hypothetical protein
MCKVFIYVMMLQIAAFNCHAQTADTAFVSASIAEAKIIYSARVLGESLLYNGSDYGEYIPLKDEHPFYLSDDWIYGSVTYDGQYYDNIMLQYDIASDQLVIESHMYGTQIQLIKSRVHSFTLEDRKFVNIDSSSMKGFYEVLYDGETKVLAKRIKRLQERVSSSEITREFEEKNKYYMLVNGEYVVVRNKKSVLKVLRGHKKELQQKYQAKNSDAKKQPERQIVILAELNDSIEE